MNLWLRSIHYLLLRKSRFLFVVGPAPFKLSMNKPQGENRPCGQTVFSLLERLPTTKRLRFFFRDRKSTRLNSSHVSISYAVFCLKKKKKQIKNNTISIVQRRNQYRSNPKDAQAA